MSMSSFGTLVILNEEGHVEIVPPHGDQTGAKGKTIAGVYDININFHHDGRAVSAIVSLYPDIDNVIQAIPKWALFNEKSGESRIIKKVVFEDGSEYEFKGE